MTLAGIGNYAPGSTALALLRQSAEIGHGVDSKSYALKVTERPAVIYGGRLSQNGLNPFDAIREILNASKSKVTDAASDEGGGKLQEAIGRFAASDVDFNIKVGEIQFPGAAAAALGDKNILHIVGYANQLTTSDEQAMIKFGEMSETSATRPEASKFSKIIYNAFRAGEVELIPAKDFGIETQRSITFKFSASGEFLGSESLNDNSVGDITAGQLYDTRFLQQDDGTRIDTETGRYASYVDVGGRDYIMMLGRPAV